MNVLAMLITVGVLFLIFAGPFLLFGGFGGLVVLLLMMILGVLVRR